MEAVKRERIKWLAGENKELKKEYKKTFELLSKFNSVKNDKDEERIHIYFNTSKTREGNLTAECTIKGDHGSEKGYFKSSLTLFRAVVEKQKKQSEYHLPELALNEPYDALIMLLGFSPQPLLHTILTIEHKELYLVTTKESALFDSMYINEYFQFVIDTFSGDDTPADRNVSNVQKSFDELPSLNGETKIKNALIVKTIGTADTFQKIRELIEKIRKVKPKAKIAIDITGGKKSMDASAFLTAAIEKDIDIFYVDFEGYEGGKPVYGTEFLNKLENPYDIYNVDLMNKGKELFHNHNYQAACDIFTEIEDKLDEKINIFELRDLSDEVRKLRQAAGVYKWWDQFEYHEAYEAYGKLASTESEIKLTLNELKRVDENRRKIKDDWETYFKNTTDGKPIDKLKETYHKFLNSCEEKEKQNCISALYKDIGRPPDFKPKKIRKLFDKLSYDRRINCETLESLMTPAERKWFIFFAFDLFCNAKRREDQGRFEDATIRLTRILEIYAQYMFIKQGNNPFRKDNGDPVSSAGHNASDR